METTGLPCLGQHHISAPTVPGSAAILEPLLVLVLVLVLLIVSWPGSHVKHDIHWCVLRKKWILSLCMKRTLCCMYLIDILILSEGVQAQTMETEYCEEKRHPLDTWGRRRWHWKLHVWNTIWELRGAENNRVISHRWDAFPLFSLSLSFLVRIFKGGGGVGGRLVCPS